MYSDRHILGLLLGAGVLALLLLCLRGYYCRYIINDNIHTTGLRRVGRPPAAPRTPVMVDDVGKSSP